MHDSEAIEMMRRASAEIKDLRAANNALAPKAEAYDSLVTVLDLLPKRSRSMSEDVAWKLDKRIEELKAAMAAENALKETE
jgi:hypothetical protein